MEFKKISIITPTLNRKKMLEDVIRNVLEQNYSNFEHIVVDGGSTDGTQEIVKKYPHVLFICAPDQGMYDALNKGLDIATGEIIGFLNTDDLYANAVFRDIAVRFDDETVAAVAGHANVFRDLANGDIEIVDQYSPDDKTLLECSTIGSNYFNAWFFRSSVFKQIGKFDVNYQIAGDREFMFRFALSDLHYIVVDELIYRYRRHQGSLTFDKTDQKLERSVKDHLLMTSSYFKENNLPSLTKKLLIQLRTRDTVDITIRMLGSLNFNKSIYYLVEGIKYDLFWPLTFLWRLFQTIVRILDRVGR